MASNRSPLIVMRDTRAWQLQVWVSFGVAVFLCVTGLAWLPGQALDRAFMVMGYVFCLSTVFVLSKAVRDRHEADLSEAQVRGEMQGRQQAMQERAAAVAHAE